MYTELLIELSIQFMYTQKFLLNNIKLLNMYKIVTKK